MPYKILIVEDEILIADYLKRYLLRKGHQVVGVAISYEEAKTLYLHKSPDISLIDIQLQGTKTGIDFARFIRRQASSKPFIYLTSFFEEQYIQSAKHTFPAAYLSKPIHREQLNAVIEITLHRHRSKLR